METKIKFPKAEASAAAEHGCNNTIEQRPILIATTTAAMRRTLTDKSSLSRNKPEDRGWNHFVSTLAAGVGSGALSSTICAPLDLMRTRMQVWGDMSSSFQGEKLKPRQVFQEIYQKEGPKGMFRGLGATLVTVPLFWGVYFPLYDQLKYEAQQKYPDMNLSLVHCGSAVVTGAVADLICNPLFVIRTRLQTQALHQLAEAHAHHQPATVLQKSGMLQTGQQLFRQHGPTIFWRGMSANLMGLSHVAVQFPAYEYLKKLCRDRKQALDGGIVQETPLELLVASGSAKMFASLLTYPHEVLRSRMMDSRQTLAPTLRGTARTIYKQEGVAGFYSGLPVTLIRVIPNSCITFLSYELLLRWTKEYLKEP